MTHHAPPNGSLSPTREDIFLVGERRVLPSLFRIEGPRGEIQLEPRAMQVLVYLSRRAGQVVSREDLLRDVWCDSVVTDEALTRTIFDLRKAFDDSARDPAVIETIRKGGYRLIAPVRPVAPIPGPRPASPGPPAANPALRWGLVAGVLLLLLALTAYRSAVWRGTMPRNRVSSDSSSAIRASVQLTSFRGYETHPALSPDGRLLAFSWGGEQAGEQADNVDIYLKAVDSENPLRLTRDPDIDDSPAFSPDGRQLAFVRHSKTTCGIYLIDVPGRDVRRVAPCREAGISPPTWSADGQALIYADRVSPEQPYGLRRVDLTRREERLVTAGIAGSFGDIYPAVAPDGRTLAFVRATAKSTIATYLSPATGDIHLLDLDAAGESTGPPRRLTLDNEEIPGLAWTADGRRLVFATYRGDLGFALWQVSATGGSPVPLIEGDGLLRHPAIARQGNGLAYEQWTGATDIRRVSVVSASTESEIAEPRSGQVLVSSTRSDFNPCY